MTNKRPLILIPLSYNKERYPMKSKKIIFVSLILISLTALLFTGCTPAAEKKDDSKTAILGS